MYDKIQNPITGRMVQINSKLGNKILNKYINMIGGVNPHTKTEWSSYSCKLGNTGINNIPITRINCNNQKSHESTTSRCKWSEKGEYCRKRQSTSRIRAKKNWDKAKNLSKNATRSSIDSKKRSAKDRQHWAQAQDYGQKEVRSNIDSKKRSAKARQHWTQAQDYGQKEARSSIDSNKRSAKARQHWAQAQDYGRKEAHSSIAKTELKTRSKSPAFIIATKNYTPINDEHGYASFMKGDKIINIIDWKYPRWIYATVERTGESGWIPANNFDINIFSWVKKNIVPSSKNISSENIPNTLIASKNYTAPDNNFISFKQGDEVVNITNWMFPKWIYGTVKKYGKTGWMPSDYFDIDIFKSKEVSFKSVNYKTSPGCSSYNKLQHKVRKEKCKKNSKCKWSNKKSKCSQAV